MSGIRLIVGLGNPGPKYADTRHNVGFWWVAALAGETGAQLRPEARFHGLAARTSQGGRELWLLEPQTYMNHSGRAVGALAGYYKIAPDEILVVHDELDLPPGTMRLKKGGGHGGHNGLKDIVAHLNTAEFWRLRLGIGHPGERSEVSNYVLNAPRREEQALIEQTVGDSLAQLPLMIDGNFSAVMLKLHTKAKGETAPRSATAAGAGKIS